MIRGLPEADVSHELSLAVAHFGIFGILVVKTRMGLLVDRNEGKLDQLGSLGPCLDLVVGILAEELNGAFVDIN